MGESVLADDHQCDKKHPDRNRIAQLITARGSLPNDVEKKFEAASLLPQACDFSSRLRGNANKVTLLACA
jgi:hypothetical protein